MSPSTNHEYFYNCCERHNDLVHELRNRLNNSKAFSHTPNNADGSLTSEISSFLLLILRILTNCEMPSNWNTSPLLSHSQSIKYFPTNVHLYLPFSVTQFLKGMEGFIPNCTWPFKISSFLLLFPQTHHISSSPLTPTPSQPFHH